MPFALMSDCGASGCVDNARNRIAPSVPVAELGSQDAISLSNWYQPDMLHVRIDHNSHQFSERYTWLPLQFAADLARISLQVIHFSGPKVSRIDLHALLPVQVHISEGFLDKFLHGMCLASAYNIVARS